MTYAKITARIVVLCSFFALAQIALASGPMVPPPVPPPTVALLGPMVPPPVPPPTAA